jgi:long-chain fatty acid transport protein
MARLGRWTLGITTLALLAAAPARPQGLSGPETGIKAMGMAGAWTAQANDPTAIFYNPGGLALFKKGKLTAGFSAFYHNESQYQGLPPGAGTGTTGQQEQLFTWPVHAFAVKPLGPKLKLGLGVSSPYAFKNQWENADNTFPGRFASKRSELQTYDTNVTLSWQATPNLGLGLSGIYRNSKLSYARNLAGVNPATGLSVDVGSLNMETDYNGAFGGQVGLLQKIGKTFAWGLVYRSPIDVEQTGAGRLTQITTGNSQLDQLNRATFPYDTDLPLATTVRYPASASLGIALSPSEKLLIETDVGWSGWSHFKDLNVSFPTHASFNNTPQGPYDDALAYRLGVRLGIGKGMQLRFGYAFAETPQADDSLSPFLPDANRSIVSLGFGRDWLDIGFQYVAPENRIVRSIQGTNALNGAYSGNSYLLGVSITK